MLITQYLCKKFVNFVDNIWASTAHNHTMQQLVNQHIIKPLKRLYRTRFKYRIAAQLKTYERIVDRVRIAGRCRVLFIASSLPMWRYQELVKLMLSDGRFDVKIAIIPFKAYTAADRRRDSDLLLHHFESSGYPAEIVDDFAKLKDEFKPDMIVYPQPYDTSYDDDAANWLQNRDCLIVHTPYSVPLSEFEWYINVPMHNLAWRFYVASEIHADVSRRIADNRGANAVIIGEPHADEFKSALKADPWKHIGDGKERKRLIWAPHFTIVSYGEFDRPDFNWSYKIIQKIAKEHKDTLQIAFKPHPRLKSEMIKHPEWGPERTEEFYRFWAEGENTQLETGDFVELFKGSDAMIHNCGSFTAEYLFTGKPVGYITKNVDGIKADMNAFGRACQDAHYTLDSEKEIRRFIEQTVLGGHDSMKEKRYATLDRILYRPQEGSVAAAIMTDLTSSLFG